MDVGCYQTTPESPLAKTKQALLPYLLPWRSCALPSSLSLHLFDELFKVLDILVSKTGLTGDDSPGSAGHASPDVTQCAICITCNEILASTTIPRFPFLRSQPFSSQPVLKCGVIPPQAHNSLLSLLNFRKFLLVQFSCLSKAFWVKLCHLVYQSLSLTKHHSEFAAVCTPLVSSSKSLMKISNNSGPLRHSTCYWPSAGY